jgi:hypothetical protein
MLFYITFGAPQAVSGTACVEANRTACTEVYCSSVSMLIRKLCNRKLVVQKNLSPYRTKEHRSRCDLGLPSAQQQNCHVKFLAICLHTQSLTILVLHHLDGIFRDIEHMSICMENTGKNGKKYVTDCFL